ncbi:MAG: hypothetical protein CVU89_11650 [Firmicutes bacterium HGW-Firmicutes-14]|nr:MAG: hypothetical protein CVU89_11650 [Firmicutes bacterium HGW-Firmicutes-14]
MRTAGRISSILNYRITINLDKRINRNKSLALLLIVFMLLTAAGYYAGKQWIWPENRSYFEYRIDNLKEVLKKHPDSGNIRAELALTEYLNGNSAKSIGVLRDILTKEPGNQSAALYLGLILSEEGDYKESIGLLTNYIKQRQGIETRLAFLYLGRNYLEIQKYDLALKYLKVAAVRDPGNPVIYYYLGQTYEKLDDLKNAKSSYEKALSLSNGFTEAEKALTALVSGRQ